MEMPVDTSHAAMRFGGLQVLRAVLFVIAATGMAVAITAAAVDLLGLAKGAARPAVVTVTDALKRLQAEALAARDAALPKAAPAHAALVRPAPAPRLSALAGPVSLGQACALMQTRVSRGGQTVTFRGEYMPDRFGQMLVRPLGCAMGGRVVGLAAPVRTMIDLADPPQATKDHRRVVGLFTATLAPGPTVGLARAGDARTRLVVTRVRDLESIGPPAPLADPPF
jgi:hypothetical protein